MLSAILLHLAGDDLSGAVIDKGVELARRHEARVRGLTIADTRKIAALAQCESAAYAVFEHERLQRSQTIQAANHFELAQACLQAGVNFDVRKAKGDPQELLRREVSFHDLVIAACPSRERATVPATEFRTAVRDIAAWPLDGIQPLLILREKERELQRTLLVYDGTPASGRAIKSFLSQNIHPNAELRLLAVGRTEGEARGCLREMGDYFRSRRTAVETGYVVGGLQQTVNAYAAKWDADLVVLGATPRGALLRRLWGEAVADTLHRTSAALYVSG